MNEQKKLHPNKIVHFSVEASVGSRGNFRGTVLGQLFIGFLYSFGYFDFVIVGLIIGYILPVIWVISSYRFLKYRAVKTESLPFPGFIRKDPGNMLVIIADIIFLSVIWFIILSGLYDAKWLKSVFTMLFPFLTLSMMRSLIIIPQNSENNGEK